MENRDAVDPSGSKDTVVAANEKRTEDFLGHVAGIVCGNLERCTPCSTKKTSEGVAGISIRPQ